MDPLPLGRLNLGYYPKSVYEALELVDAIMTGYLGFVQYFGTGSSFSSQLVLSEIGAW